MGKFKEMDLLRQEREVFDADYPMEPTPRADMWIAWNSEDGFTFWDSEYAARLCSAKDSIEWPVQYVMQKAQPAVQGGSCGHESCDCRSYCKKQQPTPVQEPVDWQFFDKGCWWNSDHRIKNQKKDMELAGYKTRDLYTSPSAAPWIGLTDAEVAAAWPCELGSMEKRFARTIEAKLKEKNRG
jgi:hypothetical protein